MMEPYFTTTLIITELIFSTMVLSTLKKTGGKNILIFSLAIFFSLWLVGNYTMLSNGFFRAAEIPQITFALLLAGPVLLGLLAQKFRKPLAIAISNMSTAKFLSLQQMRTAFGLLFFFIASLLPVRFQFIGGLGYITAGIGAFRQVKVLNK